MTQKTCQIKPIRAEIYDNGIRFQKPCGVKYNKYKNGKEEEVHCDKYENRTCEYLAKKHITDQFEEYAEELKIKGEIL